LLSHWRIPADSPIVSATANLTERNSEKNFTSNCSLCLTIYTFPIRVLNVIWRLCIRKAQTKTIKFYHSLIIRKNKKNAKTQKHYNSYWKAQLILAQQIFVFSFDVYSSIFFLNLQLKLLCWLIFKRASPCIVLCTNCIGHRLFRVARSSGSGSVRYFRSHLEAGLTQLVQPDVTDRAVRHFDHAHVLGRTVAVYCSPFVPVTKLVSLLIFRTFFLLFD
jgi:hypothetical protein